VAYYLFPVYIGKNKVLVCSLLSVCPGQRPRRLRQLFDPPTMAA